MIEKVLLGSKRYWGWLGLLLVLIIVGVYFYITQLGYGLGITGLSRDVSWGLYIAHLTFFVGVAASAVMVVLPYYLHNHKEYGSITAFGEFLAVSAVIMSVLFVMVDLGQPSRVLNIFRYPTLTSPLFWDTVVLSIYMLLNLFIAWNTLDAERKGEKPLPWVKPLILISIPWAISIHTVTAFIYSGLIARPFWMTALLAPRFLASAFASGPALLIILLLIVRKTTRVDPGKEGLRRLAEVVTYGLLATLFFLLVELFTTYYSGNPEHLKHFQYLLFGLEGHGRLVPWMWTSIIFTLIALGLLLNPGTRKNTGTLAIACAATFIAIWIDKGLGLIVPGFIPAPTGQITEYWPTIPETFITLGVWAIGFLILTILFKVAIAVKENSPDAKEDSGH